MRLGSLLPRDSRRVVENAIFLFQIISGVTALLVRDSLVHGILNGSGKMGWGSWGPKFPRHPNILCTKRQRSTDCLLYIIIRVREAVEISSRAPSWKPVWT